jgi:hypothetical protein
MNFLFRLDPAYLNLTNAVRGTLVVVLSFLIGAQFSALFGILGGLLGMLSSILINDSALRDQKKTFLLLIPASLLCMTTSVLISVSRELQMILFLVITYAAIDARKYGSRGLTLGFLGFMTYFAPIFLKLEVKHLLSVAITTILCLLLSYAFRFYLLPERPEKIISRYVKTFNKTYEALARAVKNGEEPSLRALGEITLQIEAYSKSEELQVALFEKEMALRFKGEIDLTPVVVKESLERALTNRKVEGPKIRVKGFTLTSKMAIQATVATALATVFGLMISESRWYWAPLTSFVIMVGSSRGETFLRAVYRVSGTILGLFLGLCLIFFVQGHASIEWSIIVACIFLGIFVVRFTFGFWTALVFTVLLVILFDLMGQLNNDVLVIRFAETLLGALLGAASSSIVLPTSTRQVVKTNMAQVIRTQIAIISQLPLSDDKQARRALVQSIRDMDREFANLRVAGAPYVDKVLFLKKGNVLRDIYDVTAIGHYVRRLATNKESPFQDLDESLRQIKTTLQSIAEEFESNRDASLELRDLVKTLSQA